MLETWLALFPEGQDQPPQDPENYLCLQAGEDAYYVPLQGLSPREDLLLSYLQGEEAGDQAPIWTLQARDQVWYDYLWHQGPQPQELPQALRMISLDLEGVDEAFDYQLWQETFVQAIPSTLATFFISERQGIVLLDAGQEAFHPQATLEELLMALSQDFNVSPQAMLGFAYPSQVHLPQVIQEEWALFNRLITGHPRPTWLTMSQLLVQAVPQESVFDLTYFQSLRQWFQAHPEEVETVQALFASQGNLSQAAERLFIHRHTLTNRLQRITQLTGFNIQFLPDLLICYWMCP